MCAGNWVRLGIDVTLHILFGAEMIFLDSVRIE